MNLTEAYGILRGLVSFKAPQEIVPCLRGTPGLGKSDLVRQLACELATESSKHAPDGCALCGTLVPRINNDNTCALEPIGAHVKVIDVRLANFDPIELKGLPFVSEGKTVWGTPSWFPTDNKEEVILFFDEIFNAPPAVQNVSLQVILDRCLNSVRLGDKVRIVAAGNRSDDGTFTSKLSTALATRLAIVDVEVDPLEWVTWARNRGLVPSIVAAVEHNPKLLVYNKNSRSTPRTVTKLAEVAARIAGTDTGRAIHEIVRQIGPSIIGESAAVEMAAFIDLMEEVDPRAIVEEGVIPPLPDAGKRFATTCAVAHHVSRKETLTEKEIDNCLAFCKAVGNEYAIKFLTLIFSSSSTKKRSLLNLFLKKTEFKELVKVAAQALGLDSLK